MIKTVNSNFRQTKIFMMESENQDPQIFYPYQILYEFVKRATRHYENGNQKQLMACVIGFRKKNKLIGEELIFPQQTCPHANDTKLGKDLLGK